MKKSTLAGLMVIAFCFTWRNVAGTAWQAQQAGRASEQAYQAYKQASQADDHADQATRQEAQQAWDQAEQAYRQAQQAYEQAFEKAYEQAYDQPPQTYEQADALFHTRASWGVGAGLLVDVLLLVGIVAWQKITFKA